MKKHTALLFCGILTMALLLSGCLPAALSTVDEDLEAKKETAWEDALANLDDAWSGLDDDWSAKSHYWQILDSQGEEIFTIDSEAAVQQVDDLIQGDMEWKPASSVEDETALYTYVFMQQKTLLAGQAEDTEREYQEVLRFTVYEESDVMSMTVLEGLNGYLPSTILNLEDLLTIHAKAPEDTAAALRDPAQFAQTE